MILHKSCYIFLSVLICSCSFTSVNEEKPKSFVVIDIQPFSDMKKEQSEYVYHQLQNIYSNVEIKKEIELPKTAYYKPRNRYRADSLIGFLNKRTLPGHVIMGLTNKDISWTKGTIKDYGIMGLGLCPGQACVASTFRLSKTQTLEQLFKVAIHELGHTQGLPHCPVKTCFMRDAEGKNPTNEEKEFCAKCKALLISKGWTLK